MNVHDVAQYAVTNGEVSSREKLTLIVLATLADEEGWVHTPVPELCRATGATQPTLSKSIKKLEALGVIEDYGTKGVARLRRVVLSQEQG